MAKRKRTAEEKAAAKDRREKAEAFAQEAKLLKRYAAYCWAEAKRQKVAERGPLPPGVSNSGPRKKAETAIRSWYFGLSKGMRMRAVVKMQREMSQGCYTPKDDTSGD